MEDSNCCPAWDGKAASEDLGSGAAFLFAWRIALKKPLVIALDLDQFTAPAMNSDLRNVISVAL
jgi:hypothetical protein